MNTKTHISSLFFIAIIAISCCTKKAITDEAEAKTKTTVKETTFDSTGYTEGIITYSEEEDICTYTILIKDNIYYDPVDLKDEFKVDGMQIYFKFTGLRMMNRCNKANPVKIREVVIRK